MSQNSLVLPTSGTVSGLQMTQNTNNALDTLNTLASGASAPASPEAGQLWHDTTNNLLKIRSLDNTTWIPFVALNEGAYSALPYLSSQITGDVNRIVNPAMDIDQANEGSSYSIPVNNTVTYAVDQWWGECISTAGTAASGITAQRVADAPAGFTHSLKVTVGTGASAVGAGDYLAVVQPIEANNISDLGFGTANAAPVSLSFWVKSSVAGTFAVALGNVSPRQIISTFTVASAGVWQKVTIQNIPGDQAGTWGTGNAVGLLVTFTIAAGSNYQSSTLGSWVGELSSDLKCPFEWCTDNLRSHVPDIGRDAQRGQLQPPVRETPDSAGACFVSALLREDVHAGHGRGSECRNQRGTLHALSIELKQYQFQPGVVLQSA